MNSRLPDLIIGIGNCGRSDDGLGWAFLDRLQQEVAFSGQLEYRYQLGIEDAELISRCDRVLFVDSYQGELPGGFDWKTCDALSDAEFTSHVLPPGAILHLCQDLYRKFPRANLLLIEGSCWELRTGMSAEAEVRLDHALQFFKGHIRCQSVSTPCANPSSRGGDPLPLS